IFQNLQDGREDELRAQAASTIDDRKRQAAEKLIVDTTANKQGPLSPEEKQGLVDIIQSMNESTDPNTVLETAYGKQFMATLDRVAQGNSDNVYSDVKKDNPEVIAKMTNDHEQLISKMQVIDTLIEDTQDTLKHQGYIGYGYDVAKQMIPGYTDYQLRGLTDSVGQFSGIGRGENLELQRKELLRLPIDEMAAKMKAIVDSLSANPQLQMEWLKAMKGQSSDDVFISNWTLPTEFIGTGIGTKIGKVAGKAIARTFKSSEALSKLSDAKKAVEDVSKAAAMPNASKSTIEAAAGDLQESAVTRATTNAVADINDVPEATKRGIEALSETHRADLADVAANPGRFGQDIVNRITERGNQIFSNLIETALNIQKNERLPDVLANETAVRLIVEDMKGKYTGLSNSIIDNSKIYKEPLSNTYLIDFKLGLSDGSYFTNRDVAENFIKFHKLNGAEVVEGGDIALTKSAQQIKTLDKRIAEMQSAMEKHQVTLADSNATEVARQKAIEQHEGIQNFLIKAEAERGEALAQQANKLQTATVEQQGLGYYVKITKPVDETRPAIRDALAQTGNTKIPESPVAFFLNNWIGKSIGARIGKLRTPEDVLSLAERQNRLTTTYAPSSYFKIMMENSKDINALQAGRFSRGRKRWVEWQRGLENAQELPDPLDPKRTGYFFKDPAEMEGYWQQWFHRLPDEREIGAYFEFKRGMEIDRVFRNIAEHRNQSRVGAETHNIILNDAAGKAHKSPDFNGVVRQKIPGSADNIAVFTNKTGEEKVLGLSKQSLEKKREWQKDIDSGRAKLIELYDPKLRPLSGFSNLTDERVRYVLVPQVETRALDWNHVPRRGG